MEHIRIDNKIKGTQSACRVSKISWLKFRVLIGEGSWDSA